MRKNLDAQKKKADEAARHNRYSEPEGKKVSAKSLYEQILIECRALMKKMELQGQVDE